MTADATTDPNTGPSLAPLALVTGASSGIGRALASQFVEHGYDLVVVAEDAGIHFAAEELRASGRTVTPVQADLATGSGVEEAHRVASAQGRPLDAVALNAGVGVHGRFDQTDLEDQLRLVDLNCRSTVHLARLVLEDMVARGEGRVLVTSSIVSKAPGPWLATYAASKAFTHSFAEAIRYELKDTGVTVTSLMPGGTDTEFFERADMEDTAVGSSRKDDPEDVAKDGFEAMMAGKAHVVAGSLKNRVLAASVSAMPDELGAAVSAKQSEPRSGSD